MINYRAKEIVDLIKTQKWKKLNEYEKIGAVYYFVQNNKTAIKNKMICKKPCWRKICDNKAFTDL